jgi:hypothetical protein
VNPDGLSYGDKVRAADEKQLERLRDDTDFQRMVREYPHDGPVDGGDPGVPVAAFKAYREFQRLGGVTRYLELGGDGDVSTIKMRLEGLQELIAGDEGERASPLDGLSDEELAKVGDEQHLRRAQEKQRQRTELENRLTPLLERINRVENNSVKGRLLAAHQKAVANKDNDRFAQCDKAITDIEKIVADVLKREGQA